MLVYIANTLKEVFCDCKIYRMGGDEFLVFCQDYEHEEIKKAVISETGIPTTICDI